MGCGIFGLRGLTKTYRNYVAQAKIAYSLTAAYKCRNCRS